MRIPNPEYRRGVLAAAAYVAQTDTELARELMNTQGVRTTQDVTDLIGLGLTKGDIDNLYRACIERKIK